jgi:hypothetical protein
MTARAATETTGDGRHREPAAGYPSVVDDVVDDSDARPGAGGADLSEPEGVDAGSLASTAVPDRQTGGDVRTGGAPERAGQPPDAPPPAGLLGPPRQEPGTPGQELSVGEG